MVETEHYRKLERMYLSAPINALYLPTIKISEGASEISIKADKKFFHAADALHGAVYFKMLDDAAFFAANSIVTDTFVLTTSFNIHFFRPVIGGMITSKGRVIYSSKNLFVSESELYADDGIQVAFGIGNFVKSRRLLNEEIGYV